VIASLIMIPASIIWAAAQIQAFALILAAVSTLPMSTALIIAVAIVITYTWLGGLLGDVLSDVIQGIVIILGMAALLILVIQQAGGFTTALALIRPEQLHLLAPGESMLTQLNVWLIPVLGSLIAPEALSRTLAARNGEVARKSCIFGGLLYLVVGLLPVFIALIGCHLIPPVSAQDMFLPTLVESTMPPWAMVLFLGALASAILSTIDSTLLSIAGLASHNLILHGLPRPVSDKSQVLLARLVVLAAGLIAYLIATQGQSIYALVQTASSFGSAGFLVCVLGGLYLPKISALGATVVLFNGLLLMLLFDVLLALEGAFLYTLIACTATYLAFWLIERKNNKAPALPTLGKLS
jgi:Na+/proline symporter